MRELISKTEFAKRVGTSYVNIDNALKAGVLQNYYESDPDRQVRLDWETQKIAWESRKTNILTMEQHIGDPTVYEVGDMQNDPSQSRFDDIPIIDQIQAPVGSVAYFQAKKLGVDALRNLNKLKIETAQMISVPDAINLYCDTLSKLADTVQTIPARVANAIIADVKRSVGEWNNPPENLEAQIFRIITLQIKDILQEISQRVANAETDTEEFIQQ